jgi:hypothetical protein
MFGITDSASGSHMIRVGIRVHGGAAYRDFGMYRWAGGGDVFKWREDINTTINQFAFAGFNLYEIKYNGTDSLIYKINGTEVYRDTAGAKSMTLNMFAFGRFPIYGDPNVSYLPSSMTMIAAFVWADYLSATDDIYLEQKLKGKYNVPIP